MFCNYSFSKLQYSPISVARMNTPTGEIQSPARPCKGLSAAPLNVGVLVDLEWSERAGGHVKCWERLANAAAAHPDALDVTVHFSGAEARVHRLADNVRFVVHRPVFSTRNLPFLSHIPDHTDLFPYHAGLARRLRGHDVLHTTDAFFAFARTAVAVSRRFGIPLVNSVHTDTPAYTRVFAADTVKRLLGSGSASRFVLERVKAHERAERRMRRKLARHQERSAWALVSDKDDRAAAALPPSRVGELRRGIDRDLFHPNKRDRAWLEEAFGVPQDRVAALFVGRLNKGKNVMTAARAIALLVEDGAPLHFVCAGDGEDRAVIQELLGDRAACPGVVDPATLARMYASSDVFAFPSEIEIHGNVVMEALASGLPSLVAERGGMGRLIQEGGTGRVLPGGDVGAWARAIGELRNNADRLAAMGRAARDYAERALPSWEDVLLDDLLPRWRQAAAEWTGR